MLSYRVKYVRILRTRGKTKDRWYAQLSLEGKPAVKYDSNTGKPVHPVGRGAVGLDIGPQTLAYAAANEANLVELAESADSRESWIAAEERPIRTITMKTAQSGEASN